MKEDNSEHIVYSKNVIEFATVANEYCNFIESKNALSLKQFLSTLQKLLPLLYLKASMIPDIDDIDYETPEKFLGEVDYNFLLNKLSSRFGAHDNYLEVFDPAMQYSESPIESSIAENLCDIYQDLKDFIFAYRIGTQQTMSDAICECKNNFNQYWGQKLVNGLRAIHSLLYSDSSLDDNDDPDFSDHSSRSGNWVTKHFSNDLQKGDFSDDDL